MGRKCIFKSSKDYNMSNHKEKVSDTSEKEMHMKVEEIDNKLASIKSDTQSLNRIFSMLNTDRIKEVLLQLIKTSEVKAAALYLTKNAIQSKELASKLGIDHRNLSKFLNPFLERGYITPRNIGNGRETFYKRAEFVDLIGYDRDEDFMKLVDSWKEKQTKKSLKAEQNGEDSVIE